MPFGLLQDGRLLAVMHTERRWIIRIIGARRATRNEREIMSKAKDELRREYRREELGKGLRGKCHARVSKGTNLVLLNEELAKAFPITEAVDEALAGFLASTEQAVRIADCSLRAARKRAAG